MAPHVLQECICPLPGLAVNSFDKQVKVVLRDLGPELKSLLGKKLAEVSRIDFPLADGQFAVPVTALDPNLADVL